MEVEKMTDKELKSEAKALDFMIYEQECYGTKDLQLLDAVLTELDNRGIELKKEIVFS